MPQFTKSSEPATTNMTARQGLTASADDPAALDKAIELAVDYRGDVTVTTTGGRAIECFIFDLKRPRGPGEPVVRYIERGCDERESLPLRHVASVTFSGRDTAAGKSFETWMRKYVEKKLAGERASIESEPLDESR